MYYPKSEVGEARRVVGLFNAVDYNDADDLRAQLVGWDREITLLEPGPLMVRWWQAALGDVVVADAWHGRATADWSTVAAGRLNFVVRLDESRPGRWCGLEALPGHAIVAGAGRDFHAVQPAGLHTLEFIAPEALVPALRSVRAGPNAQDFSPRTCLVHLDPATRAKVDRLRLALFADPVTTALAMADPLWVGALRQQTLGLLATVAAHIIRPDLALDARAIPGYTMVVRAMLHMDENAPWLDRVVEVAEALGVSTRALQQAFRGYAGITPHQYLLARKLHLARRQQTRALAIRSPVTDAAISSGITHFGRFSGYYRSLFGEAPRDTLARATARLSAAAN
jgi:AraC-like DNA-binding protein